MTLALPPGERGRRRRGVAVMIIFMVLLTLLVGEAVLERVVRAPLSAPFRTTVIIGGQPQFGPAINVLRRGEAFGWMSTHGICISMPVVLRARLVAVRSGEITLARDHGLDASAWARGSPGWDVVVPAGTKPGSYRLDRSLNLTGAHGEPLAHHLPPFDIRILP